MIAYRKHGAEPSRSRRSRQAQACTQTRPRRSSSPPHPPWNVFKAALVLCPTRSGRSRQKGVTTGPLFGNGQERSRFGGWAGRGCLPRQCRKRWLPAVDCQQWIASVVKRRSGGKRAATGAVTWPKVQVVTRAWTKGCNAGSASILPMRRSLGCLFGKALNTPSNGPSSPFWITAAKAPAARVRPVQRTLPSGNLVSSVGGLPGREAQLGADSGVTPRVTQRDHPPQRDLAPDDTGPEPGQTEAAQMWPELAVGAVRQRCNLGASIRHDRALMPEPDH